MNRKFLAALFLVVPASGFANTETRLLMDVQAKENSLENVVYRERLPSSGGSMMSALGLRAGKMSFSDLGFRNDYSVFSYSGGEAPILGLGLEAYPLNYLGNWGAYFDASYAFYKGSVLSRDGKNSGRSYVSLLPVSVGGMYVAEFHPVMRWFAPTVSVGAAYNFFLQGGELDHFHARGATWTLKRSFGIRHSLAWAGMRSTQLSGDLVIHSPFSALAEESDRFTSRTVSIGFVSNL